jgi:RNA polymerase sigma-70 factor, ECF subfamily
MLARAERKTIFHLPVSPRASAKQGGAALPVATRPGQSRFPLQRGAQAVANHRVFDFDDIFRTYQRTVYSKCFRILRNHGDAEDVVQEVFLQLLRKADTFRGEAKFSTWLHRLTINTVLMQLRKLRRIELRTTHLEDTPNSDDGTGGGFEPASFVQSAGPLAADRISLRVAISQLPRGYQEVFCLHDVEGYTHVEISKILGISLGTSKSQLHKARLRLRVLLQHGFRGKPSTECMPKQVVEPPQTDDDGEIEFRDSILGFNDTPDRQPGVFGLGDPGHFSNNLVAVNP